jgi:hypothetical protein
MHRLARTFAATLLVLSPLGCNDRSLVVPPTPPPFTIGVLAAIDPARGYLVEADSGSSAPLRSYFRLSAATTVSWQSGAGGSPTDLQIGRTVGVWQDGPVLDSVPPRIIARQVVIYR